MLKNLRRVLAEWEKNKSLYLAWPHSRDDWQESLVSAQEEWLCLVRTIHKNSRGLVLLYKEGEGFPLKALTALGISCQVCNDYQEIWMRDSSPFYVCLEGKIFPVSFRFNSWGGKYSLDQDACFYQAVQPALKEHVNVVLEGGAVDFNGAGLCLTTEECLLNENRNPEFDKAAYEKLFKQVFGVTDIFWIPRGMNFDHTDGHVDNIARFIDAETILINDPTSAPKEQRGVFLEIEKFLRTICSKRNISIVKIPCPQIEIMNSEGSPCPVSYLNFNFFQDTVLLPSYGSEQEASVWEKFRELLPRYRIYSASARVLIRGGGSFHCLSHQSPFSPYAEK